MGTRMFTCRYNFYDWGFLSTVWTRLPLEDHAFPKRTAKLIRRNGRVLKHVLHPARCTAAEERLFQAYRRHKTYDLHESAADYLRQDPDAPFDTWQISVFEGDKLVAFSYFDRGNNSLQSVCGFYDPDYSQRSLGLYTLTLEVLAAKRWGMQFHYAGYLVPGNRIFEYKRRAGGLQCFDDTHRRWYPIDELDASQLPDAIMRQALLAYDAVLREARIPYTIQLRPNYFISVAQPELRWIRREQLPFCIADKRSTQQPFWACHFYSYNFSRYFSLLCTNNHLNSDPSYEPNLDLDLGMNHNLDLQTDGPAPRNGGIGVRVLHQSKRPFSRTDFERIWEEVTQINQG